jgi:predicted transcriptional regulator
MLLRPSSQNFLKNMTIKDFVNGRKPECTTAPHGTHVKVKGMEVKTPYCLYCRKKL